MSGRLMVPVLIAFIGGSNADAKSGETEFKSSLGYSASYPSAWSRIDVKDNQLDIVSPGQRDEGVVIGPGQAEVIVEQLENKSAALEWAQRLAGGVPVSTRFYRGAGLTNGCARLYARTLDFDAGEGEKERNVAVSCEAGSRHFMFLLRYWQNDRKAANFLSTTLQIARSVRVN